MNQQLPGKKPVLKPLVAVISCLISINGFANEGPLKKDESGIVFHPRTVKIPLSQVKKLIATADNRKMAQHRQSSFIEVKRFDQNKDTSQKTLRRALSSSFAPHHLAVNTQKMYAQNEPNNFIKSTTDNSQDLADTNTQQTVITNAPYAPPAQTTVTTTTVDTSPAQVPTPNATVVTTPAGPPPITNVDTIDTSKIINKSNRISFKFQNIDIRTLIQLIAKVSGRNFIISDSVKGLTTINLNNVTWEQALIIILKANALAYKKIGDTLFISTIDDLTQKQARELQSATDIANLLPLASEMITLRYTDATNIIKMIKSQEGTLLTARGEIAVDLPTNTVILRDTRANLRDLVRFIRRLDVPARQVEIEARIVTIDSNYEGQIGVRFGISNRHDLSGTFAGASQLARGVKPGDIDPVSDRLNFNLPANLLSTGARPASIGLALAKLGPVLLDMELSALEEEGHSQIISRPRVITANQQKALIQTGEEIPYQQATSSGATSVEFKKAVLSLEIVPQITPDDKVLLKLKATQDTKGPQLLVAPETTTSSGTGSVTIPATFGPPTINTQEVQSYVLLNDNETVVIGGIYKLNKTNTLDRVPFFSNLPIIGNLFKHRGIHNERTELLFFVTPHIIKQRTIALAGEG